ncbi:MAG: hypothetical protein LBV16_06095 [Elusimicrobiota bacterium]|nr:hypothetical protein [Elusimicrobiota bacterium]
MKNKIKQIIKSISKLVGAGLCVCLSLVGVNNHSPFLASQTTHTLRNLMNKRTI